ncbi:hypothetical protein MPTK1_8g15450 [Marchantia polymorpha subsp. ruderalis]|uniref:Glycosyltransferase family 92 protein n=2 Tax=Marchantia polymorpha TaxID=3197 RepID=A0A176WP82_MARPO|nr:hypothetical protein AXG93_4034s1070 [Marchantia polymorpha subsp. ruderalis]PTQ34568.1 hypothetical protein MARPO_0079s0068 [Marchantia polymorpha]BBN19985.1 hypothetical protein Mp_8g15450 [Marchantia polymorpha subsp. ruderalis]|eukprot:PTQ34568.1 hypothetical protein MARPO_0079s0068 [Marchantia polymorpha]
MAGGPYSRHAPLQQLPRSQQPQQHSTSRILLWALTMLPLGLAAFAFGLQWKGGALSDPATIGRLGGDTSRLPGVQLSNSPSGGRTITTSDCAGASTDALSKRNIPSFPHHPGWQYAIVGEARPKICICTSTSAGLDQILPWLYYHRVLGVTNFLLFVEGKAASRNSSAVLEAIPGVQVVHRTKELEEKQAKSRIWNETWLSSFFFRPCNYELFVRQSLNMEMAIVMARAAGMDWIIHLDTDELLHPAGSSEFSLRRLLGEVADDVDMVVFPNYESAIERDDIKEPFTEVSMFKKNYDHVMKETYFGLYREATRGNPNYFLTYGNGKAAARVQNHLRPNGAHRWHNYMKNPNEIKLEEAAVLHFTYTKFSDLTSRRDRCGCKPTKEDVKKCFMLEFDRDAFIIASTFTEEEMRVWYRQHVVWTDKELNLKLMRKGLLTRIYAPMVIIQGLREAGVFSDALIAGQELLEKYKSRDEFLSSVSRSPEKMKSSLDERVGLSEGEQQTMRKTDEDMEISMTTSQDQDIMQRARRQLQQFLDVYPQAMPPMGSPDLSSEITS